MPRRETILNMDSPSSLRQCTLPAKKYTPDHEWISIDNGVGTIGITDYAQKALGDVVFVESPSVGSSVDKQGKMMNDTKGVWIIAHLSLFR
jgi:hypothetical protein